MGELNVSGVGYGIYGYGDGDGSGSGYGDGSGSGYGYGDGYGSGYGYGSGLGYGDGYGYGSGYGDGYGSGDGDGSGSGYGYGDGYGDGSGSGYGDEFQEYMEVAPLAACRALALNNVELRRIAIAAIGPDRFFGEIDATVVHEDIDGCGNPRALLRIPVADAEVGYLQAVRVVCPTTGRIYHLGVEPGVTTCQAAVASTFGLSGGEYRPERET